ncbi:MAG TPA: sugar ABC transporter permease [Firmicutes bacterium]|nr:sugar ABC transporter permease [Bacillota bacterium]
MTTIEYLSMPGYERLFFNFLNFFKRLPHRVGMAFNKLPTKARRLGEKMASPFTDLYSAAVYGDWRTRLSFLIMGFGQVTRRQVLRGILYFLYEVCFIVFMILVGGKNLAALGTLGQLGQVKFEVGYVEVQILYDDSLTILIYSVLALVLILLLAYLYVSQIRDSLRLQRSAYIGHFTSDRETLRNVLDKSYHRTLLCLPMAGVVIFTVVPVIIMTLICFTNYNDDHLTPAKLIDWVGFQNFATIFSQTGSTGGVFLQVFGKVLLWTLIWAFFATFTNYFLGMVVAMMINAKGVKLKKFWRTILITTIAVPQFISLLLMSQMFEQNFGVINQLFNLNVPWFNNAVLAKVMVIVINTWLGIPYTMLICTGLLMNIPADLYESAKIDGAGPFKTYMKITLPYMLFVTTPYLISQFVGNINNFNVIYLLTQGGPQMMFGTGVIVPKQINGIGETDLLITWIYKMCMTATYKDYGTASVLGLLIFVVVAFFSLVVFNNSKSVKNEEDYQL